MDEDQKLWETHCKHRGVDPNDIYVNKLGGEE